MSHFVQKASFKVIGMYRTTCKAIGEKQLKGEHVDKAIEVDLMTDSVVVEYDADLITRATSF